MSTFLTEVFWIVQLVHDNPRQELSHVPQVHGWHPISHKYRVNRRNFR